MLHRLQSPVTEPHGAGFAGDVEVVFERDGKAVEWSDDFACFGEMLVEMLCVSDAFVEHDDG